MRRQCDGKILLSPCCHAYKLFVCQTIKCIRDNMTTKKIFSWWRDVWYSFYAFSATPPASEFSRSTSPRVPPRSARISPAVKHGAPPPEAALCEGGRSREWGVSARPYTRREGGNRRYEREVSARPYTRRENGNRQYKKIRVPTRPYTMRRWRTAIWEWGVSTRPYTRHENRDEWGHKLRTYPLSPEGTHHA